MNDFFNLFLKNLHLFLKASYKIKVFSFLLKDILSLFGFCFLAHKFFLSPLNSLLTSFYAYFLRPSIQLRKIGSWAIVTGATDGIGKAYAEELASKKFNIILISRNADKLKIVGDELKSKYQVNVAELVCDFSNSDRGIYQDLQRKLNAFSDIAILVNNVGVSYDFPEYFNDISDDKVSQLININIIAATFLTKIVLPIMITNGKVNQSKQYSGVIINIGSASGLFPQPLLACYSASKAYLDYLSRSLTEEMLKYHSGCKKTILVQSVMPLYVTSKLSKLRRPTWNTPTPAQFARSALATVGYEAHTSGYWAHDFCLYLANSLPQFLVKSFLWTMHSNIRKLALKKLKQN